MLSGTLFETDKLILTSPFSLRLAQFDPSDARIIYPHVGDAGHFGPNSSDPDYPLAECYESMRVEALSDPLPVLTDAEKLFSRNELPLPQIYERWLASWRQQQRLAGKVEGGTLQKERQSLRDFGGWDADPERSPPTWPRGIPWKGLPPGFIAPKYVERWIRARLAEGMAAGTMRSRWNHLRTVFSMVRRLGIIDAVPKVDAGTVIEQYEASLGEPDDDLVPTTYNTDQLSAVYEHMHEPDLKAAWVLGCNCGPRSVDLFNLYWSTNVKLGDERPELFYKAKKTGKRHWIPLHPVTVAHLKRLIALQGHLFPGQPQGLVFPRLTSKSKDPEKGLPARRRNERIKAVMSHAGIDVERNGDYHKPWQVLRSTCNSRLNNHRSGAGRLVTHGKDADVSSTNYWDHHPTLIEAIATLPMPTAFSSL